MAAGGDETRKMMGDPYALGGFVPDRDRHGIKCSGGNLEISSLIVALAMPQPHDFLLFSNSHSCQ